MIVGYHVVRGMSGYGRNHLRNPESILSGCGLFEGTEVGTMRKNGGMLAGWIPSVTGFSLALLMLGGCAQIGPASISHGRGAYNEVIAKTDHEQRSPKR